MSEQQAPATRALADCAASPNALPDDVQREARRALLNIVGCMVGGSRHDAVDVTLDAYREFFGPPQATLVGLGQRADALHATYINCLGSSANSFDDSHGAVLVHPSGPVASALLALSERAPVNGPAFLEAFVLGVEVSCRLARSIALPPAKTSIAWVLTGLVSGIGTALAVGRLLGLDARQLACAIGIAGAMAAGYRQNQGSMCTPLMPAHAARSGLQAALLAARGHTSSDTTLEGSQGFGRVFSESFNANALTDGLGSSYDFRGLTYKPYPSGVVLNPVIEAGLRLHKELALSPARIAAIHVTASPAVLAITDRPRPTDEAAAQLSFQHWSAMSCGLGIATLEVLSPSRISDADVVALRTRVTGKADEALALDAAHMSIVLSDGSSHAVQVDHCVGGPMHPMSDRALDLKFEQLSEGILDAAAVDEVKSLCWGIDDLADVARIPRAAAGRAGPA